MPKTSNLHMASACLALFSFLLSIILGDSFGASQVVMGLFGSSAPILVSILHDRSRLQGDTYKAEIVALKTNIQSLEAEVSRINLALKLRN